MLLSSAALFLVQVGPNPTFERPPIEPEELTELRRRQKAGAHSDDADSPSTLAECLALANESPVRGADFARGWRETARGEELAESAHCLGFVHVRSGKFGEAMASFATAYGEARGGTDAERFEYRARLAGMAGHAAIASGDPESGADWLEKALVDARMVSPPQLASEIAADLARTQVELGRNTKAAATLAGARRLNPPSGEVWLLSATLARREGQLAEARSMIDQALSVSPAGLPVLLEAGVISALLGDTQKAANYFSTIETLAPGSQEAITAKRYHQQLGIQGESASIP
jgi:tetratricopeptide (TPR) repeat protein